MKILHYTLGLPPCRSGGLTKYSSDLMTAEFSNGEIVSILYPGDYYFWKIQKRNIIQRESYNGINVYELSNPSPVPLLHGIKTPSDIFNPKYKIEIENIDNFFNKTKPDIFHIHTLMGLPIEILKYLHEKGVKILFTSHDYYGICPKVNLINQNGNFCNSPTGKNCAICNSNAPGSLFLRLRNSSYFLKYKNTFFLKSKRKKREKSNKNISVDFSKIEEYSTLLKLYNSLFEYIDYIHFNSLISKEIYEKFLPKKESTVIPISHANIKDCRIEKKIDKNLIRFAFIGNTESYKGFPTLKFALLKLLEKKIENWELQVWGGNFGLDIDSDKIIYKGKYSSSNLKDIFNNIDLLIVPSIWKETFSLVTLEAIVHGTPCLVSENVGAKEIIKRYNPDFIFSLTEEKLDLKLEMILKNENLLQEFNKKICSQNFDYSFKDHVEKMELLYRNILQKRI